MPSRPPAFRGGPAGEGEARSYLRAEIDSDGAQFPDRAENLLRAVIKARAAEAKPGTVLKTLYWAYRIVEVTND